MPRFYFDIFSDGHMKDRDEVGQELRDRQAAWEVITRYAADSLRDLDGDLRCDTDWRFEVRAPDGARILHVTIRSGQN